MKTNVVGSARIYANERQKSDGTKRIEYSTKMGRKREDGSWENAYPRVNFGKCQPPQVKVGESVDIEVDEGFFSFDGNYTPKVNGQPIMRGNGKPMEVPVYKVVITKWHSAQQQKTPQIPSSFATIDEDEPW